MSDPDEKHHRHFTTRRGFVAASGFGVVSLYLLWAGYGAAPLRFGGHVEAPEPVESEHGAHGAAAGGMSSQEFERRAKAFAKDNRLADGSVRPGRRGGDDRQTAAGEHAMHGATPMAEHAVRGADRSSAEPIDIYLAAYQWGYTPEVLRLETGVLYRFRMMAVDVAHGASLRLGPAARIVRLRPGALVEQEVTFSRPGEYLLYCTVYCGIGHDRMQGRIVVTQSERKS